MKHYCILAITICAALGAFPPTRDTMPQVVSAIASLYFGGKLCQEFERKQP